MFISYAQNLEDVMLWRALRHVESGFYIDVGAWDPVEDSVTKAFYDAGWHGVNIEPEPVIFERLDASRERDVNLPVAVAAAAGEGSLFLIGENTGWHTIDTDIMQSHVVHGRKIQQLAIRISTLSAVCESHAPSDIHFLKIDVEGAELAVLKGADFERWRPWIVVVEATLPNSPLAAPFGEWEPLLLQRGYRFAYFDGLNRFYLAEERAVELAPAFDRPPNLFDAYVRFNEFKLGQKNARRLALLRSGGPECNLSEGRLELDDRLVFMHLMKTAGTTVHHALAQIFPSEQILTDHSGAFSFYPREFLQKYRYYSAHAHIDAFRFIPKPLKIITFFRHPVDRLISHYEYCTSYTDEAIERGNLHEPRYCKMLSLGECLSSKREIQFSFQWNPYVQALIGADYRQYEEDELLDRALEVLDALSFVGISEDLKSSFELLSSALDIPNHYAGEMLNVTKTNKERDPTGFTDPAKIDFSDELMKSIDGRIRLDMVLYRHAVRRLFGKRGIGRVYVGQVGDGSRLRTGKNEQWVEGNVKEGFLLIGPYASLFPGTYRAEFRLRDRPVTAKADIELGVLDVVGRLGAHCFAKRAIFASDFGGQEEMTAAIEFVIFDACFDVEFRVRSVSTGRLSVAQEVRIYDCG